MYADSLQPLTQLLNAAGDILKQLDLAVEPDQERCIRRLQKSAKEQVCGIAFCYLFVFGAVVNFGVCYALPQHYPALGHAARVELLGTDGVLIIDDDHTDQLMYSERKAPHVYIPDHSVNMVFLGSGTPGDGVALTDAAPRR